MGTGVIFDLSFKVVFSSMKLRNAVYIHVFLFFIFIN